MDNPTATTFLRYARKQAKAFRKEPPVGAHQTCAGCQLGVGCSGVCGHACIVITRAAERWQRGLRAASLVGTSE